jgi:hypothetical protein
MIIKQLRQRVRSLPRPVRGGFGVALLGVPFLIASEQPLQAYIDPGTGSMVYQMVLTAVLGAGFIFRRTLASLLQLVRGRSHDGQAAPHEHPDQP